MLELALAGESSFVLDRRELEREGPSFTVETLRELRREFPGDHVSFLVGADAARELRLWHRAEELPKLAQIVVLTRPGVEPPDDAMIARVVEVPAVDVSATDIRRRVARGESIAGLVPAAVERYIREHKLYSA